MEIVLISMLQGFPCGNRIMQLRVFISVLLIVGSQLGVLALDDVNIHEIKVKYRSEINPNEKAELLEQIIQSYLTTDIDSALYYSDIYRQTYFTEQNEVELTSSDIEYHCKYYKLLSKIYKSEHSLVLFLEQSQKALECYSSIEDKKEMAGAYVELGTAQGYQGKITDASQNFLKAKQLYKDLEDQLNAMECTMHIGTTKIMQGDRVGGLENYMEALEYYESNGYEDKLGKLCNNIGNLYIDLSRTSEALHYFQKALAYAEKVGDKFISSQILANIAGCYNENSEHQISLGYLSKGLKIAEDINSEFSKSIFYYEIASTKNKLGKNYEALDAINQSLDIVKEMNNVDQIARCLQKKSDILLELSNFQEAHNACKECYEISNRTENLAIKKVALKCIHRTSNALKIYREAYEFQNEYIEVSDSLQLISSREKLIALEKENEFQKERELLEQKNLLNEALLREEKNNTKIFALLSLLSLVGLGLLGFIYLSSKKYTNKIKEKTKQIESNNTELSKLNKDLKSANSKLNNFTSVAAHDLKSPLRTMASYSQLLMMRNKDKFEEKDEEMLTFVSENARRLTSMIDDLLTFSKINEDLGPSEHLDTREVIDIVTDSLETVMKEKEATIRVNGDLGKIHAHQNLITQLFQNLIANGIKFQQPGVKPVITINKVKETSANITYSVGDNGIGIEKEHQDKIFTIFKRLHNHDSYEGSGIGLSTCKSILDYYEQDIRLESEVGRGTTFFFSLPK